MVARLRILRVGLPDPLDEAMAATRLPARPERVAARTLLSRRRLSVHERADRLLRGIWSRLTDVADTFERRREDWEQTSYRLAWSESIRVEEIDYLLDYMQRVGWIEERSCEGSGVVSKHGISIDGHARLAALE